MSSSDPASGLGARVSIRGAGVREGAAPTSATSRADAAQSTRLEERMTVNEEIVEQAEEAPDTGASSTGSPPGFSSEELTTLLSLMKDSDSVELKLTLPETQQRS